jgi:hypothetical protein
MSKQKNDTMHAADIKRMDSAGDLANPDIDPLSSFIIIWAGMSNRKNIQVKWITEFQERYERIQMLEFFHRHPQVLATLIHRYMSLLVLESLDMPMV